MIFKIHSENVYGIKKLTYADLGQNIGHQTHIGLYEGILTYLSNEDEIKESYLIYENKCDRLDCYFDRIKNPDGTFRSPKIRMGETDSIVKRIREYAANSYSDLYLMWFSLDNGELLFLLFKKDSADYQHLVADDSLNGRFIFSEKTLKYVFSRFNETNESILTDLELNCHGIKSLKTYRRIDIERANELFRQTGKIGEELICKYLDTLKFKSKIIDYSWMNQSRESGLPYDFTVIQTDNTERYIDVKTTRFKFNSPLIFSSQETSFISNNAVLYSIYRTYNISNNKPKLRICDNSKDKIRLINDDFSKYSSICKSHGYKVQSSFIIQPDDPVLIFSSDIQLEP